MSNSVYRITEIIGTSTTSWEDAVKHVVETASKSLRDLRVAEVSDLDVTVENGRVTTYRAKVKLSFKYEDGSAGSKKKATKKKTKKKNTRG